MSTPPNQQPDPEQLRREIEEIRRELGKTVAQLAQKADVEAQVREDGARSWRPARARTRPRSPSAARSSSAS